MTATKFREFMNTVLCALTKLGQDTPVKLSFHQMCAHSVIKTTQQIIQKKEPVRLYEKITNYRPAADSPRRHESSQSNHRLSISRESFIYQAIKLYYSLPVSIQNLDNPNQFNKMTRSWIEINIPIYM